MSTSDALGRRDAVDPAGTARIGRRGATVDVRAALVPLWRGQVVFRVVALVYAVVNVVRDVGFYVRPALGVAVVVVMALWTLATSVAYLRGARRLAVVDLVVTVLATISTLAVDDPARIAAGGPVITTVWSAGAVLAVAIAYGIRPAVGAVAVSAAALWVTRRALDAALLSDVQLLLVAGVAVGFASVAMRRSAVRLQEAIATEAAAAERERLARDIHDGVLQVLALMRRRGPALGDPELVRAAAEQEVTLRRLITRGPVGLDNLQMPHLDGVGATAAILAALPGTRVLVLSASAEQGDVLGAVQAGAAGYLVKSAQVAELVDAVERTAAGQAVFGPELAGLVLGEFRRRERAARDAPGTGGPAITTRETEVLRLVAKGLTARRIAERLGLSPRTVENHVQNVLRKLQLTNRVELARYAIEQGLDRDS